MINENKNGLTPIQQVLAKMLKTFDEFCAAHDIEYWVDGGTLLGAIRHKGFIPWDDDVDICVTRDQFNKLLQVRHELPDTLVFDSWHDNDKSEILYTRIRHKYSLVQEPNVQNPQGIFMDILTIDNYNPDGSVPKGFMACKRAYSLNSLNRWNVYKKPAAGMRKKLVKLLSWVFYLPNKLYPQWYVRMFRGKVEKWTSRAMAMDTEYMGNGYENSFIEHFRKDWLFPLQRLPFEDFYVNAPANTDPYLKKYYGDNYMTPLPPSERTGHFSKVIIDDYDV